MSDGFSNSFSIAIVKIVKQILSFEFDHFSHHHHEDQLVASIQY